jgi:hypothetical protein
VHFGATRIVDNPVQTGCLFLSHAAVLMSSSVQSVPFIEPSKYRPTTTLGSNMRA